MKIGIDASMLAKTKVGIGHYVTALLNAMPALKPDLEFIVYTNTPVNDIPVKDNLTCCVISCPSRPYWTQKLLPKALEKDSVDLFWGGNYAIPVRKGNYKKVITVHDFVYRRFPETLPLRTVLHLRTSIPLYLRSTDHVIADSENTARDLWKYYRYSQAKTTVVPLAARSIFTENIESNLMDLILHKHGLDKEYLLFVGTVEPRKGIDTVVKALARLKAKNGGCPGLVVVGQIGWKADKILNLVTELNLGDSVCFLNYVEDEDLPALYKGAAVLVYPSLYEGFGLPVVEAMAVGTPVITSSSSSLPEVGGDAVLYINAGDDASLVEALEKVLGSVDLQQEMRKKGLLQAKRFSWGRTAWETLKVFMRVLGEK